MPVRTYLGSGPQVPPTPALIRGGERGKGAGEPPRGKWGLSPFFPRPHSLHPRNPRLRESPDMCPAFSASVTRKKAAWMSALS